MATETTLSKKYYGVNVADEAAVDADMKQGRTLQEAKKNLKANAAYNTRAAAPAKSSAITPVPTETPSSHVVKEGDTIGAISKQYGVDPTLISGYQSKNADLIFPGETLTIGKATTAPVKTEAPAGSSTQETPSTNPQDEIAKMNDEMNAKQGQEFSVITAETAPTVDLSSSAKLAERLVTKLDDPNGTTKPPSLVEEFSKQRQALGVGADETALAGLDARLARLDADYRSTVAEEEQKQVSTKLIGRKTSKAELVYSRAKGEITAERNAIADRIDTKLGIVKTMVELTGQDYTNAKNQYDTDFNRAIQLTNLVKGIEDSEKSTEDKNRDDARANMTVMYNLLKEGNIKYENLDASAKTNLAKMEIQAGLPSGMFRYLQTNIKDDIVASSTREVEGAKYYDVIIKGKDGALTTKSIYIGKTDGGSDSPTNDSKIVENFSKDVVDTDARIKAGSNGQFMRSLYAKYPKIDKADIERKVNETYPDGWDG